jgi:hypothetical protein
MQQPINSAIASSELFQNPAGMATVVKIAARVLTGWSSPEVIPLILDLPGSTCEAVAQDNLRDLQLTEEQLHRASLVLDMHASLRTLFMNTENVKRFMTMPNNNEPFAGRAPLDLIASGDIGELIRVQGHLAGMVLR